MAEGKSISLWDRLQGWAGDSPNRAVPLPRAQTDLQPTEHVVRPDGGYLRLRLSEMRASGGTVVSVIGAVRHGFARAADARATADAQATLYCVRRVPANPSGGFALRGALLSDWLPYRGGDVQAAMAVIALPRTAAEKLGALEKLSENAITPLSQALAASEQIEAGVRSLLGSREPTVLLAWTQALTANGRVSPAYIAVRASGMQEGLSVRDGQLLVNGRAARGDFLLARIETTASRDDVRMPEVEGPLRTALESFLRRDFAVNAPGLAAEALEKILNSPDLAGADRQRIAIAVAETLGEAASAPHGATGEATPTLADMVGRAQPASAMLNRPMPSLRQLMSRVVPMEAMMSGGEPAPPPPPPPPTGVTPAPSVGTSVEPEPFEAYPRLDAPARIAPDEQFPLTVGFRTTRDATLAAGGELIEIEHPTADDKMIVTITSFDVEVIGDDIVELPLAMDAEHVFSCKPKPGIATARIRATYFYQRQCVGFAEREIAVGAPEAMLARPMASEAASACRMQMPPPPELAVDIEVHLSHHESAAGSRLIWEVMAANPARHWKLEGPSLPNAAGFAARLITLMDSGAKGQFALNALQTIGQDIRAKVPQAFFNTLAEVRDAVRADPARAGDAPTMLWYTDTETFIPWELVLLPESKPGAPVFLGQAWRIGRWLQCEGIQQPPPVMLDVQRITAVASAYGLSTPSGLRSLAFALPERKALHDTYGATEADATQAGIEPLIAGMAQAGHLIHFAVHGTSIPKADSHFLSLEDRSQLYPEMLVGTPYQCGEAPLFSFVFINACQVGTSGEVLGVAAGFPGRIVRSGACGFIAPLWSVDDETAHNLATRFYEQTLRTPGGTVVGEVLRAQRAAFDPKRGTTPMAYIYYGHPNLRLTQGKSTRAAAAAGGDAAGASPQGESMSNATMLDGSGVPVSLAPGYSLRAPGVVGAVREQSRGGMSTRSDSGVHEKALYEALERHKVMGLAKLFEVQVDRVDTAAPAPATRAGEPALEFRMPADANVRAVVLYTDENGISTWVRPEAVTGAAAGAARGGEGELVFRLPRGAMWQPPAAGETGTRGPIGVLGRRVIRALYWATDEILGKPILAIAEQIEKPVHPYRFHRVTPETYQQQDQSAQTVDWDALQTGRALLLLHGTFSSAEATYWSFPRETIEQWHRHYGGRVFAFNHPTVYHSPQDNIDTFLAMMPPGTSLDLDVITHSRGGLVGRELAERLAAHNPGARNQSIRVHNTILFASPNEGTPLVDADRETELVDVYTNFLTGLPDNAVTLLLEGILAAVKIVGHATVTQLPGLASFRPRGPYLTALNEAPQFTATYHAVGADYSPETPALADWFKHLAERAKSQGVDTLLDAYFGEPNDAVVPARGSYEVRAPDGASRLLIPEERRLVLEPSEHIWHCTYFGHPRVNQRVLEWLGIK